jgi:hypothetical protein
MIMHVKIEVKDDLIGALLVAALEGGSSYWCHIGTDDKRVGAKELNYRRAENVIIHHIDYLMNKGGSIEILDFEDVSGKEKAHVLNKKKICKGIQVMSEKYPSHFGDLISKDFDGNTADVFLQCVIFGEVIYVYG